MPELIMVEQDAVEPIRGQCRRCGLGAAEGKNWGWAMHLVPSGEEVAWCVECVAEIIEEWLEREEASKVSENT